MRLTRRTVLAGVSAALIAPRVARAITVADDAGRAITVTNNVRRVFPAGPAAAVMIYTLAPDLLLGWPRPNRLDECAYMLPDICARPDVGRLTGRGATASLKSVLALKPDLIVDVGTVDDAYISLAKRTQEQTGIPYALLDGRILSLSTSYERLDRLVGRERDGLDFADYCNMTLGSITDRIALVAADQRPRVYYARGPRGLATALRGSIHAEAIELVARNVAGEKKGDLADVPIEQVLHWNPDVIIAADREFAASVRKDPAWASVKAVREGQVHVSPRLPFGWIDSPPSANRLVGLWWLVKLLYPDFFPEDIRELTREFFTKFYHVAPTDARIDHVLAARD